MTPNFELIFSGGPGQQCFVSHMDPACIDDSAEGALLLDAEGAFVSARLPDANFLSDLEVSRTLA